MQRAVLCDLPAPGGSRIGRSFEVLYLSADAFRRTGERIPPIMTHQGHYADDRIMKRVTGELYWRHVTGRSLDRLAPHGAGVWTFKDLSATRRVDIKLTPREREIAAQWAPRQDQQANRPCTGH